MVTVLYLKTGFGYSVYLFAALKALHQNSHLGHLKVFNSKFCPSWQQRTTIQSFVCNKCMDPFFFFFLWLIVGQGFFNFRNIVQKEVLEICLIWDSNGMYWKPRFVTFNGGKTRSSGVRRLQICILALAVSLSVFWRTNKFSQSPRIKCCSRPIVPSLWIRNLHQLSMQRA